MKLQIQRRVKTIKKCHQINSNFPIYALHAFKKLNSVEIVQHNGKTRALCHQNSLQNLYNQAANRFLLKNLSVYKFSYQNKNKCFSFVIKNQTKESKNSFISFKWNELKIKCFSDLMPSFFFFEKMIIKIHVH